MRGDIDFWRAIEIAGVSELADDVADVGRYVASRGESAVTFFSEQLEQVLSELRAAGVADAIAAGSTTDGRRISELSGSEVDRCLESMIFPGRRFFEALLEDPSLAAGPEPIPMHDLRAVVEDARRRQDPGGPALWVERPGDRRRNGELWIVIHIGSGLGVGNLPPWNQPQFGVLYRRAAVLASLDDSWREVRAELKIRALDIVVEYWHPSDMAEHVELTRTGRTMKVLVCRATNNIDGYESAVAAARGEARVVLGLARDALKDATDL